MTRIFIRGCGAVSPAGWGVQALIDALENKRDLPIEKLQTYRVRVVPPPSPRPVILGHPRLRRASSISQFATAAAHEALGNFRQPDTRLGIVVGVHAASIRYSDRFFGEVLRDPATASPVLFPETVINAPASHLAASLGATHLSYSVLGDQTAFIQALHVAAGWLAQNRVDLALVVGSEETDWTVSAVAKFFSREVVCSEGAGAVCLSREPGHPTRWGEAPAEPAAVELTAIIDPCLYTGTTRAQAAQKMAAQFLPGNSSEILCDSRTGSRRWDSAESAAWSQWSGQNISPRKILGEALSAATAWQFIAAARQLQTNQAQTAIISAVGSNQQSIAARLIRATPNE